MELSFEQTLIEVWWQARVDVKSTKTSKAVQKEE